MMIKQLPAIILAIVCAALAVALVSSQRDNADLKARLAAAGYSAAEPGGEPRAVSNGAAESNTIVSIQREAPTNEVNADLVQDTLKSHQRVMSSIANMRENPTMNKMIEASQRGTMGALYADMIDYLNLNGEETKYFMDLIMYRQMAQVDFGMKLMSGTMSEEERVAAVAEIHEAAEETKKQMKAFLNSDDDYAEFEFYEKTIGERMALSQMDQALADSEAELDNDEYRDLLDMMATAKEDYDWSTDLHEQENPDISAERFSEENMAKHVTDIHALNELIFEQAAAMLTPEQLEAFKKSIVATTDMQLAQFEMAGQLLRGQKSD